MTLLASMDGAAKAAQSSESSPLMAAVRKVSDAAEADIIYCCSPISDKADRSLRRLIVDRKRLRKNVILLLTTDGGSPEAAYRMARALKRAYSDGSFTVMVDWYCKSAGTLLAIGANHIVMSEFAELGPLDVQVQKPDELAERTSGLTPFQALSTLRNTTFEDFEARFLNLRFRSRLAISTKVAAELASAMVIGLFGPIYQQIDPIRLGEIARAMMIASQYGKRLSSNNLKDGALDELIGGYPSHAFVIDREEAKTLFKSVREPDADESAVLCNLRKLLHHHYDNQDEKVEFLVDEPPTTADNKKDGTPNTPAAKARGRGPGSRRNSAPNQRTARIAEGRNSPAARDEEGSQAGTGEAGT